MNKKSFVILLLCISGLLCLRQATLNNETTTCARDDDDDCDYDWDEDDDRDDNVRSSYEWEMNTTIPDWGNLTESNTTSIEVNLSSDTRFGNFLTGIDGLSLYYFAADQIGTGFTEQDFKVSCYAECSKAWPPVVIDAQSYEIIYGMGLNPNLFSTVLREDGYTQLTYNNIPLYYFARDRRNGDTYGQGIYDFGGYWYLINSEGHPIKN